MVDTLLLKIESKIAPPQQSGVLIEQPRWRALRAADGPRVRCEGLRRLRLSCSYWFSSSDISRYA